MLRKHIYGLFFIISSIHLLNVTPAVANELKKTNTPIKVLVYGDSLSAAYNIPVEQGWVALLQTHLNQQNYNVELVNASISGETTSGGLDRLSKQLQNFNPDILLLELGGNDGLRGIDLSETRKNLTQIINISLSDKFPNTTQVLLAGIKIPPNYGRTYTKRFEQIYSDLSANPSVQLIPFILSPLEGQWSLLQADGIHPKAEAQPLIMQNVAKHLIPMLSNR